MDRLIFIQHNDPSLYIPFYCCDISFLYRIVTNAFENDRIRH